MDTNKKFCARLCEFLSPTEAEQNGMKGKPQHMCTKYNEVVHHGIYHPELIRLEECDEEG
jgi:hypothetical protein